MSDVEVMLMLERAARGELTAGMVTFLEGWAEGLRVRDPDRHARLVARLPWLAEEVAS